MTRQDLVSFVRARVLRIFPGLLVMVPIQQLLVSLQPGWSGPALFGQWAVTTLVFAVLSWKFVEEPAIALKRSNG